MSKHTQGPWKLVGKTTITNNEQSFVLANVGTYSIDDAEAEANARLIAASPNQHAALIESADAIECAFKEALTYIPNGSCLPDWLIRLEHAAKQARAAIANAKGQ